MTIRALLIDAVGTLITLREPATRVYVRIAHRHGLACDEARVARRFAEVEIGPPSLQDVPLAEIPAHEREGWRAVVRYTLSDAAADGPAFDELFAHYSRGSAWRVEPGAREVLEGLRERDVRAGVLSNMDDRLRSVLADLDLIQHLHAVVIPATSGLAKPDPRSFRTALLRLGARREEGLYVGDREPDCVEAARRAGLRAILYAPDRGTGWPEIAALL